jgi:putative acetyltransferase
MDPNAHDAAIIALFETSRKPPAAIFRAMTIELAGAEDLERIVALSNRAAEISTANFATSPEAVADWQQAWESTRAHYPWLVARVDGAVVGFAKASPHRSRGAYRWTAEVSVYIDDAWQGRRVGRALYDVLIPILRAQGYVTLLAGITAGHAASERLHERVGFVRCGTFHRAGWKLGGWHDVGYWELQLQPVAAQPAAIRAVTEVWGVTAVTTRREPLSGPIALELIGELNAELAERYPEPGANHFRLDEDEVAPGRGAFLVAWLDGAPVACGAVRLLDAFSDAKTGEIKRMYVRPAFRGRRIAAQVLAALEDEARVLGVTRLVLETGERQQEAIALYVRAGFSLIPPYGEYVGSPLSICLAKQWQESP